MAAPNRTPLVDPQTGMVTGAWLNYFVDTLEGGGGLASFSNVTINRTFNGGVASGTVDVTIDAARLTGTTLADTVVNSSLTGVGTLTSGRTGAGFTVDLAVSPVNGSLPWSALPAGAGTWTAQPTIIGLLTVNGGIRVLDDIQPQVNFRSNLGALTTKFRSIYAAELFVETLVAQEVIATIGGHVLVAPTTSLTADLSAAATTITVKHNNLANGDRVLLSSVGQVEWMAITSGATGTAGLYTYTVTRNLDGTGANAWTIGDAVLDTGTTGNGFIDLYSTTGIFPGTTNGPTIVGNARTGTTYSDIKPRWAIGNLKGLFGYIADTYGAAFGDELNTIVTVDATNGFRIRHWNGVSYDNRLMADTAGNLSLTGDLSMSTSGVFRAGATAFATGTGWWLDYNAGTPRFRVGNPAGNNLSWDGTTLSMTIDSLVTPAFSFDSTTFFLNRDLKAIATKVIYPGTLASTGYQTSWYLASSNSYSGLYTNAVFAAGGAIYEHNRTTAMGEWILVTYAAGNFTGSGAMTWTVDLADQAVFAYTIVGKTMTIAFILNATTVGGVADTSLIIAVPGGFSVARQMDTTFNYLETTGLTSVGLCRASGTSLSLFKSLAAPAWALTTNGTYCTGTISFEIN